MEIISIDAKEIPAIISIVGNVSVCFASTLKVTVCEAPTLPALSQA